MGARDDEVRRRSERSVVFGKLEIQVPNPTFYATFYVFSPFRRRVERTHSTAKYFSYSRSSAIFPSLPCTRFDR
jgi:hypothetical protein